MKKFVELAVTNRQTVKGSILFTVNAFSPTGEVLGKFVVKQLDLPNMKGVFVKYFPSKQIFGDEDAEDYSSLITLLQVIADDQEVARDWFSILTTELDDATIPSFYKFMLSQAVSIEDCSIEVVPIQFAFILTEMVNKHLVNKGWFGVEVKADSTLAEKVSLQFAAVTPSKHAASTKVGSSWYVKN